MNEAELLEDLLCERDGWPRHHARPSVSDLREAQLFEALKEAKKLADSKESALRRCLRRATTELRGNADYRRGVADVLRILRAENK